MNDDMLSPQALSIEPLRRARITAISSAVQRRPVVLVLGMHRSGTSVCSHILSALGVDMPDDIDVSLRTQGAIGSGEKSSSFTTAFSASSTVIMSGDFTTSPCR
jgi:hypothetical protein